MVASDTSRKLAQQFSQPPHLRGDGRAVGVEGRHSVAVGHAGIGCQPSEDQPCDRPQGVLGGGGRHHQGSVLPEHVQERGKQAFRVNLRSQFLFVGLDEEQVAPLDAELPEPSTEFGHGIAGGAVVGYVAHGSGPQQPDDLGRRTPRQTQPCLPIPVLPTVRNEGHEVPHRLNRSAPGQLPMDLVRQDHRNRTAWVLCEDPSGLLRVHQPERGACQRQVQLDRTSRVDLEHSHAQLQCVPVSDRPTDLLDLGTEAGKMIGEKSRH